MLFTRDGNVASGLMVFTARFVVEFFGFVWRLWKDG